MKGNLKKCRELEKNVEKCREIQRNANTQRYAAVSASVIIRVPKSGESKSGQMVSEKVI